MPKVLAFFTAKKMPDSLPKKRLHIIFQTSDMINIINYLTKKFLKKNH